ncbi:hypothetical protein GOBAR_DD29272 [Gossypium barbadense]|nr:hypothetical protein GOBAR_DD29272 [Gossypium barbadense]
MVLKAIEDEEVVVIGEQRDFLSGMYLVRRGCKVSRVTAMALGRVRCEGIGVQEPHDQAVCEARMQRKSRGYGRVRDCHPPYFPEIANDYPTFKLDQNAYNGLSIGKTE